MLDLSTAQQRLLQLAAPLAMGQMPLAEAMGAVLAQNISAKRSQPSAPLSVMDGYAVADKGRDGAAENGWRLVGESRAGHEFQEKLRPGQAVRISTGAIVPDGAFCVVMQEDMARTDDYVRLNGAARDNADSLLQKGRWIRSIGHDFAQGDMVLPKGRPVNAAAIALATMAGHVELPVHRAPVVHIFDCGDELMPPGAPLAAGQIPASNGLMINAMVKGAVPAQVNAHRILPDRLDDIVLGFARVLDDADVIVTTGGVSVGDHDLIRPALEKLGGKIDFWKVAIKPGKPLMIGQLGETVILGLPGNPVSAFVTATLFLLPLLKYLSGHAAPLPVVRQGVLGDALPAGHGRMEFLRAKYADGVLYLTDNQDSAALASLSRANALIIRAAGCEAAQKGEIVDYLEIAI